MKLALMSDIHANVQALDACMAHARAQGVAQWAFLGDLVGYGANPGEVVDRVRQAVDAGAWVVRGNHDEMAVTPSLAGNTQGGSTAAWTHQVLSADQRQFLEQLPMMHSWEGVLLVHASAQTPERWRYVDGAMQAKACMDTAQTSGHKHVFVGHVHHQGLYYRGGNQDVMHFEPTAGVPVPAPAHRQWVGTVGSVGQPRDGNARAMYAIFDRASQRVTFHRVAYDNHAAAAAIRQAGLPAAMADRLETGR